jgi:hypothetical protein
VQILTKLDLITLVRKFPEGYAAFWEERGGMKIGPDKVILPHPKATPSKTETHDLKDVLQRKVIFNKPTNTPEDA